MSRYERAREAYNSEAKRVQLLLGQNAPAEPYDLTGGFVMDEKAWSLLRNPSKKEAAFVYESLLDYAGHAGWDNMGRPYFPPPEDFE